MRTKLQVKTSLYVKHVFFFRWLSCLLCLCSVRVCFVTVSSFPVVLVANAGPDMGHHGSFLTVCPLDQPDYSRNSQDLFQKKSKSGVFERQNPNGDRIKIAFTNDVAVQLTLTYTYQKLNKYDKIQLAWFQKPHKNLPRSVQGSCCFNTVPLSNEHLLKHNENTATLYIDFFLYIFILRFVLQAEFSPWLLELLWSDGKNSE